MKNGSSIIDLSPLIHQTGGYEAYDESEDDGSDTNPDYYINICQPLNPVHGLACPAGAAVCKVPVDGAPIVSAGRPGGATPARFWTARLCAMLLASPEKSSRGSEEPAGTVSGSVGRSSAGPAMRAARSSCGRRREHTCSRTLVCHGRSRGGEAFT